MDATHLYSYRHSLAHILAMAVLDIFPDAKLAIGPPIDTGLYYDFDVSRPIVPADLPEIQQRMEAYISQSLLFTANHLTIDKALACFADQPYKLEMIHTLAARGESEVGTYTSGDFIDLCKGPHLKSTAEITPKSFTVSHAAGAYWRGDEKRPMLQRIYVLAFETPEELQAYLIQREEAKARDHRLLGPALGIYTNNELVGSGLPLWLPNGETVKDLLSRYMRQKEEALGYQYVSTPVLAHESLYQRSGHATYYADDMYSFVDDEGSRFYLAPMNCPHHHMVMEKLVTSYRDLPLKLAEDKGLYRKELSGALTGLIRVRGAITMNDAHIYVTPEQLEEQFMEVLALFKEVYEELNVTGYWFRLSLPDFTTAKYGGDLELWEEAGRTIRRCLEKFGTPFVEATGEAAFYGPKLDVQVKNVTGKEDTIATSQIDILVPKRMGLLYTDADGQEKTPIVIHRAILGSYERFIASLLEQTAGNLPFWLAPIQVVVLAVNDSVHSQASEVVATLKKQGLRARADLSTESVGRKIRKASLEKIPLKLVIGSKDVAEFEQTGEWSVTPNWRSDIHLTEERLTLGNLVPQLVELNKPKKRPA